MIRLSPSTIVLGQVDLKDFDQRQRRRRAFEAQLDPNNPADRFLLELARENSTHHKRVTKTRDADTPKATDGQTRSGVSGSELVVQGRECEDELHTSLPLEGTQDTTPLSEHSAIRGLLKEEHGYVSIDLEVSPEDPSFGTCHPQPPSKDDFHYGGFVESPTQEQIAFTSPSSQYTPHGSSTPNSLSVAETRRSHGRLPLPRSPLFISQNLSTSPARRQTAGLTPRVSSRVATHNTPGIIFSQPARRPPRHSTTQFRHQTNSFSFDSSERASAAYEQERISSYSTTESVPRPSDNVNLHEELHGRLLQDSSSDSEQIYPPSSDDSLFDVDPPRQEELEEIVPSQRDLHSLSPQLPLPPPFSASSRNSSGAGVLPSAASNTLHHPITSPIRSSSSTPIKQESGMRGYDPQQGSVVADQPEPEISSHNRSSHRNLLQRAARVFSPYRIRTPSNHGSLNHPSPSPSLSPSPSSSPIQQSWSSRIVRSRSPSQGYRYHVYDDSQPAYSQPQTPAQLPEARHQSRFHSSMTAPVIRALSISGHRSIRANEYQQPNRRQLSFATPSRRGSERTNSPVGLRTRGFEGLYGGRENGDEEQDWTDGVRFSNVGTRLWGLRDARNDGRSMRETPEPEEWRVGRNN